MERNRIIFVVKKLYFVNFVKCIWTWILDLFKVFRPWLDLD